MDRFEKEEDSSKILTANLFMRKPKNILYETQGPRTALRMMDNCDRDDMLVIDGEKRLIGMARSDGILRAMNAGDRDISGIVSDVPSVRPDTPMSEVVQIMVPSDFPLPVADDDGILLGMISPSAAAETLRNGGGE